MNTHPYLSQTAVLHPSAAVARPTGRKSAILAAFLLAIVPGAVRAAQEGDFIYTDDGTSITITGYATGAPAAVVIPGTINGKSVTAVGNNAFFNRTEVTSVVSLQHVPPEPDLPIPPLKNSTS